MNQVKQFLDYIFQAFKFWIIVQPWEAGLIIRGGKKVRKINGGLYFRIPYLDSVYIQEARLRVAPCPIQTLTTKDLKTITLNSSAGYSISCIETLYDTLFHPELTLQNIAMSYVADFIFENDLNDITPNTIEKSVLAELNKGDYGLKFEYFRITNFAIVRTYRLIQDTSWVQEGLNMEKKK